MLVPRPKTEMEIVNRSPGVAKMAAALAKRITKHRIWIISNGTDDIKIINVDFILNIKSTLMIFISSSIVYLKHDVSQ